MAQPDDSTDVGGIGEAPGDLGAEGARREPAESLSRGSAGPLDEAAAGAGGLDEEILGDRGASVPHADARDPGDPGAPVEVLGSQGGDGPGPGARHEGGAGGSGVKPAAQRDRGADPDEPPAAGGPAPAD